jgi:hypothetical protein
VIIAGPERGFDGPKDRPMNVRPPIAAVALVALSGCETSGSNQAAGVGPVPPAAVSACTASADSFWSAAPGTSVVNGAQTATGTYAGYWQLAMGTGRFRSTCVVNPIGGVISISPG